LPISTGLIRLIRVTGRAGWELVANGLLTFGGARR
jgi:hypothetical protein